MPDADGQPLVSVVVPTHYRNDRLDAALDSVAAQTHDRVETIVVDDSGEAHARPVAERHDVDYVAFAENRGANAARTAGVERAAGAYVQLLDDDDRLEPEKLARQVDLLGSTTGVGVAYCGMTFDDGRRFDPDPDARGDVLDRALAFDLYPCVTSTMLAERRLYDAVLPLADRPGAQDLGLMVEFARRTRFEFVDEPLVVRGDPPGSLGGSLGVFEGRRDIVREYADLYDPATRARALASTHEFRASKLLADRRWSARAVADLALVAWWRRTPRSVALLAASLFGAPGVRLGSRLAGGSAAATGGAATD
ncbi:glycosyltransferase family 2 protein [Candidatus Halobonum tyrrellensis]|uniref:Glycosyl transferase n=1 Tax=Candidatus Halobonum tyrrellensis G22 TaxID=1324957 RepID=V4HJK0_9EURY|nr:glycosyltransferase family 2 protein [Candidatus Halobonum tyrrellensis]ESP88094.1 glycosyl transferase [Candidatus Halobonum tyrrellensis G22]